MHLKLQRTAKCISMLARQDAFVVCMNRVSHTRIHKHTHFCLCVCYYRLGLFSHSPGPAQAGPHLPTVCTGAACPWQTPAPLGNLPASSIPPPLSFSFSSPQLKSTDTSLSKADQPPPPGVKRGQISLLGIFGFRHSKRASCTDQPFCN